VVSPYGTYLVAHGYNVSALLCRFRHWFGIIQKCTSEPRVARSWQDPHVRDDIVNLRSLYAAGVHIASTVEAGTSHAVDPVLVYWKFLKILAQHRLSAERWRENRNILDKIDYWVRDCNRSYPKFIFSVQQWTYLVESTNAKRVLEVLAFKNDFKTLKNRSLAPNPELSRDQVDSSAPIESRTSDDRKDLVLDSIAMARAIWERVDRLKLFLSQEELLRQLLSYYQDEMEPRCVNYLVRPPSDARTNVLAFEMLYDWVKTDFLKADRVKEYEDLCGDLSLIFTTKIRIQEAKWLLKRLKDGMSSTNDPSGGTSQEPTEKRTE